ncbi:choice-of-anchor D domain-containing protein [Streptomyces sp. NPDC051243]|uniref:choice-of-anchor D domain-containing protein n=1 Tax=Streptomyces sp. NPDC051243 TaxID=3365646 RepID=UPI0037AA3995
MPAGQGSWELVTANTQILAVHAALLPSGKVLCFSGSEHDEKPPDPASVINATRLWNPATSQMERAGGPLTDDLFCAGHCLLPSGNVLVVGGTEHYEDKADPKHAKVDHFTGTDTAIIFDWRSERWRSVDPMAGGRWYPTCITLADGRALVLGGHGDDQGPHENTGIEIFDPADCTWSKPRVTTPPLEETGGVTHYLGKEIRPMVYYPRLHQLPDGRIFSSTALRVGGRRRTRNIDPSRMTTADLGPPPPGQSPGQAGDPFWPFNVYARAAFPSVLLPLVPPHYGARILICGQRRPQFFEPHNAHLGWRPTGERRPDPFRAYANAVLLPDASVLVVGGATSERLPVFGGGRDGDAVHWAERYVPESDTWERLAESPNRIARVYHSVALLLADGRVWIAGSNHDSDRNQGGVRKDDPSKGDARELRIEIYSPPYLFTRDASGEVLPAARPAVGRLLMGAGHGQEFRVPTPQAARILRVHLIRCGSATHAFNPDQRLVALHITRREDDAITVLMPPNGRVAPPGYYLLFLVDLEGTPSVGRFVRLQAEYPLAEVYIGRPATAPDVPDLPVGTNVLEVPQPVWDLGTFDIGRTRTARIFCKNVGTGGLSISSEGFSGDFRTEDEPDSPLTGTRGRKKNLDVTITGSPASRGGLAVLEVRFTPTETGLHTGSLLVHTNAADLGGFHVNLRANVRGFSVALVPPGSGRDVAFGEVEAGATATRTVIVRNEGSIDAVIDELFIDDDGAPKGFGAPVVLSDRLVPVGASRSFLVWFSPRTVGPAQAELVLETSDTSAPSRFTDRRTLRISAVGVGPRLEVAPARLAFGPQAIRTVSPPQRLTVTNTGSRPAARVSLAVSREWRVTTPLPGTALPPGGVLTLDVVFSPGHSGPLAGTLVVDADTLDGPVAVALEGTGVAAPITLLNPGALAFGDQPLSTHGLPRTLTVSNEGVLDLEIGAVDLVGPHAGDFSVTEDRCRRETIPPERSCTVAVLFTPSVLGARSAELRITDNASGSPRTVALTGTGVPAPVCGADPTAVGFPPQRVGTAAAPQQVTLTNNGTGPITVTSAAVMGAAAGDYTVQQGCTGGPLAPGGTCVVEVTFLPTAIGPRDAELVVRCAAPVPGLSVPLTGTGLGTVVTFDPPGLVFGSQPVGTFSARQDLLLFNTGNTELTIQSLSVSGDFRHDHSCGALRPNGYCRIRVIFLPTAKGTRTGEVHVTDSLGRTHTAALLGTGV